jgi:N-ethylmaleimide reductase
MAGNESQDRSALYTRPIKLPSELVLANRVVMLPLTRARAEIDGTPNDLMAEYYSQRAGAGLIISEACPVAPVGRPFLNSPGMYTHEHALGWQAVTEAVHAAGGKIFLQINHAGRANNLQYLPRAVQPVSASAMRIPRNSRKITVNIPRVTPYEAPRELTTREIELVVLDFQHAAQLAKWAGFDGVEIHADSGYLIHQFLSTNVNTRTDRYGGSPQNRARFVLEILDAVIGVTSPEFVAVKFTPGLDIHDIAETDVDEKYPYLVEELNRRGRLAFLHLFFPDLAHSPYYGPLRDAFDGLVLADGSLALDRYQQMLAAGQADLIGFGRAFIANPDLVTRLELGLPLSASDQDTIYSPGPRGYTDYPSWNPHDIDGSVVSFDHGEGNLLLPQQVV